MSSNPMTPWRTVRQTPRVAGKKGGDENIKGVEDKSRMRRRPRMILPLEICDPRTGPASPASPELQDSRAIEAVLLDRRLPLARRSLLAAPNDQGRWTHAMAEKKLVQ